MHLLHLCLKLCVVHPNRCFECDIYDDVQLKLYRKYIVTVHNTPAFTSKPHPKLKYNVDSAVLHCVYGWLCTKNVSLCIFLPWHIRFNVESICILRHNKVGCISQLCRFFVQTVDYASEYTVCLHHNYNDASNVCPEQGNRNQTECSLIII